MQIRPRPSLSYYSALSSLFLLTVILCIHPIQHTDVFMYLSIVRHFLTTGVWPTLDVFTYSSPNLPLQSLHEWGSYFYFYGIYSFFESRGLSGFTGLTLGKTAIVFITISTPALYAEMTKKQSIWIVIGTLFAIFSSMYQLHERGAIFGNAFACLMMVILSLPLKNHWRGQHGGHLSVLQAMRIRGGHLLFVPLIFLFWVNMHPSFPLGFGLLGLITLEAIWRKDFAATQTYLGITGLSLLACLLNPTGFSGIWYPIHFATHEGAFFKSVIQEWLPLWSDLIRLKLSDYVFMAEIICGLLWVGFGSCRPFNWMVILVFGYLGVSSLRFMSMSSVIIAIAFCDCGILEKWTTSGILNKFYGRGAKIIEWGVTICVFGFLGNVFDIGGLGGGLEAGAVLNHRTNPRSYAIGAYENSFGFGLDKTLFATGAADYVEQINPSGNIFHSHFSGCYLAWKWNEKRKVLIHGFMTDTDLMQAYISVNTGRDSFDRFVDQYQINTVVVEKQNSLPTLWASVSNNSHWILKFEDEAAFVFLRN